MSRWIVLFVFLSTAYATSPVRAGADDSRVDGPDQTESSVATGIKSEDGDTNVEGSDDHPASSDQVSAEIADDTVVGVTVKEPEEGLGVEGEASGDSDQSIDYELHSLVDPAQETQVEHVEPGVSLTQDEEESSNIFHLGLGVQTVLISDKVTMGVYGSVFFNKYFGANISGMFLGITEPSDRIDTSILGAIFNFQAMFRFLSFKHFEADAGLALEMWYLTAIHKDEYKGAMVLSLEPALILGQVRLGYELRYYPLKSDGLGVGESRNGEEGFVLVSSFNLGWRFS